MLRRRHKVLATRLAGRSRRRPETLPGTNVVKLWLVSNEQTRHFSMEQIVPGCARTGVESQRRTASRVQLEVAAAPTARMLRLSRGQVEGPTGGALEQGWQGVGPGSPKGRWCMTARTA